MAMAKTWLVVAAAIIMLTNGISAETYTVGDEDGWAVPSSPDFYSSWASKHNFEVGDILVFNFSAGLHTVAMVTKDAYDQCEVGDVKADTQPTEIILDRTGPFYFLCTVDDHCVSGLKLAVLVDSAVAPMSVDIGSSPPHPQISTFFCVIFMAFVLAFLYY